MQNCPDRLEDSRKGEETADSLSNRVFDREPHSDRDATRPDQTRPENQQRDLAFKRSIHHHCSQWYPLWGFELMTICHLTSDPWPNETSDFYSQQSFTRWNAQRVRTHNSMRRKRKRSDSVLWPKSLHWQKNPKSNVTTQKRYQNLDYTTIADLLRTVTQLVWLNRFTGFQPSH